MLQSLNHLFMLHLLYFRGGHLAFCFCHCFELLESLKSFAVEVYWFGVAEVRMMRGVSCFESLCRIKLFLCFIPEVMCASVMGVNNPVGAL